LLFHRVLLLKIVSNAEPDVSGKEFTLRRVFFFGEKKLPRLETPLELGAIHHYAAATNFASANHFAFLLHCNCSTDRTLDLA
jgi:hypothetical protein